MVREQAGQDALIRRVRSEFLEMPGLRLTEPQARRLWGLDAPACATVLSNLLAARFLFQTADGAFVRAEGGDVAVRRDYARPPLARRGWSTDARKARKC